MSFLGYFLVRMSYQLLVTIATVETVKHIPEDAYGLIYGLNTFVGLGLQCILTAIVNNTLNLSPKVQFQVYGAFYLIVCLFCLPLCSSWNALPPFSVVYSCIIYMYI